MRSSAPARIALVVGDRILVLPSHACRGFLLGSRSSLRSLTSVQRLFVHRAEWGLIFERKLAEAAKGSVRF